MPTSQNGFSANNRDLWVRRQVPGTNVGFTVRRGDAGLLLIEMAVFWDNNIEPIDTLRGGTPDDWGAAERAIRGSLFTLSNHASATAIDINALKHGLGRRNTFTERQKAVMHEVLAELDGVIRWGEDYKIRKDGMHLELMTTDPVRIRRALEIMRQINRDWQAGQRDLFYAKCTMVRFGDDVRFVQRQVGIKVVDGYYGPVTAAKVKLWEAQHNRLGKTPVLKVDGFVGLGTWKALGVKPTYGPKS